MYIPAQCWLSMVRHIQALVVAFQGKQQRYAKPVPDYRRFEIVWASINRIFLGASIRKNKFPHHRTTIKKTPTFELLDPVWIKLYMPSSFDTWIKEAGPSNTVEDVVCVHEAGSQRRRGTRSRACSDFGQ